MTGRYAAVDIGSNSCRLLVVEPGKEPVRRLVTTRLGRTSGRIDGQAFEATIETMRDFSELTRGAKVTAVATSAVRDAANGAELVSAASRALGTPIDVISGAEEGRLTFVGTTVGSNDLVAVIDVGGGSTEISWGRGGQVPEVRTVQMGAVRAWRDRLDVAAVEVAFEGLCELPAARVIAVAGTAATLASLRMRLSEFRPGAVEGVELTVGDLTETIYRLAPLSDEERRRLPGMPPDRAEIVVAGAVVLRAAITSIGSTLCTVSEHDILEGLLIDRLGFGSDDF